MLRFSHTVRSPSLVMAWGITPMERRAVSGALRTSAPSMMAVPEVISSRVVIIRISVDLPAPLGPSRPKISPSSTAKETPSAAFHFGFRDENFRRHSGNKIFLAVIHLQLQCDGLNVALAAIYVALRSKI